MNWFTELFNQQTFTQAVMVLSLICASGLALGNIKIFGVTLGVAFVFFAGIIAGHFGIAIDPEMLAFAQNFGLILYIYALGLQVGPGFFSSFKQGGIKLNVISFIVLIVGSVLAIAIHFIARVSVPDTVGLLAGAVTNTPMLGAAQQTLLQMNPEGAQEANSMAMACAVAYPFGIIGMILSVMIMRALFAPKTNANKEKRSTDNTFVTEYQISNPELTEADESYHGVIYTEKFGKAAYITKARVQLMRDFGCTPQPLAAYLLNLGLESLAVRIRQHSQNALAVARYLEGHEKVTWVNYPMLESNKYYDLAVKYMPNGAPGVVSFGVKGGREAAMKLMNSLRLAQIVVHVADARTCVLHPASTTHRQLTDEQLVAGGIVPEMIRFSVGIEHVEDIIADLQQALEQI